MAKFLAILSLAALANFVVGVPTLQGALQTIIDLVEASEGGELLYNSNSVENTDASMMFDEVYDPAQLFTGDETFNLTDAWTNQVVSVHNSYRAQYRAPAVTWSNDLYPGTLQWAQQCQFHHRYVLGYITQYL